MMQVTQAPHPNKWFDALTQKRAFVVIGRQLANNKPC